MIGSLGLPGKVKSFLLTLYSFAGVYVILYSPQLKLSGTGLVRPLMLCGLAVAAPYTLIRLKLTPNFSWDLLSIIEKFIYWMARWPKTLQRLVDSFDLVTK